MLQAQAQENLTASPATFRLLQTKFLGETVLLLRPNYPESGGRISGSAWKNPTITRRDCSDSGSSSSSPNRSGGAFVFSGGTSSAPAAAQRQQWRVPKDPPATMRGSLVTNGDEEHRSRDVDSSSYADSASPASSIQGSETAFLLPDETVQLSRRSQTPAATIRRFQIFRQLDDDKARISTGNLDPATKRHSPVVDRWSSGVLRRKLLRRLQNRDGSQVAPAAEECGSGRN
ncbi:hypothetical protein Drorol1_Dr00002516 [Drosera rotundifolia]